MEGPSPSQSHSPAWVVHAWLSFALSITAMTYGVLSLPVEGWARAYMGLGTVYTIGATLNLAKTTRDRHESRKLVSKVEEAKVERLLAKHSV